MLANVLQLLKLPDGTVKVLVEGRARVRITDYLPNDDFFEAKAELLTELPGDEATVTALLRSVGEEFERYAKVKKNIPEEALAAVSDTREPAKLADLVAGHLGIEVAQKQELLETLDVAERLEKVYGLMQGEMSVLQVEKKIKTRVKTQMERTQREYYLNEQMKAIQKELGGEGEDGGEIAELEERINARQALQGGPRQGGCRAEEAEGDVADVGRGDGGAQLPRLDAVDPVGHEVPREEGPRQGRRRCSTPITTGSRRSRSGSSNTSPFRRGRRR